jgi:sugar/nucleoside kinase (ribokinase family)
MNCKRTAGTAATADNAEHPDVAVVGETNPDFILHGLPHELPDERELLASGCELMLGSSSAIFAHNLSVLGTKVTFSSRVGKDLFGDLCLQALYNAGVDVRHVVRAEESRTGVTVILPGPHARRILTYPGAMFEMGLADLDLDFIARAKHFHLSSVFLHRKLFPDVPELFCQMKRQGLTTSLDTNDDPDDRWLSVVDNILPYVDILFCTEDELRKLAKAEDDERLISSRVPILVVKRGSRGASVFAEGRRLDRPALSVELVDAVGAGDTFDAGFLHQWLRKEPLETCLAFGNFAGGLSVTRPGGTAAFCDADYRQDFLQRYWGNLPKASGQCTGR